MKAIIFDLGNVLIRWDPDFVYKDYYAGNIAKVEAFYQETAIKTVNAQIDCGQSYQEVLAKLAIELPHYHEPIHLWETRWLDMIGGPISASVKILESLYKQGYPLYALTNWSAETFFTRIKSNDRYKFLDLFKDIVISGVEKVVKPDPKIYEILIKRNNLNPKNCIFIDDSPANLIPARNLGITTIEFTSPEQLLTELTKIL